MLSGRAHLRRVSYSADMSGFIKCFALAVVITGAAFKGSSVLAQDQTAGCTLQNQIYTCNWQAFRSKLDSVRTVAVETKPMDRIAAARLRKLAEELGKTVASGEQPADLTFLLIPLEPNGVHIGPGGEPLATLRIYAPGSGTTRGTLLWAETYTAQPDRPWPTTVHALIEQFKERISKH